MKLKSIILSLVAIAVLASCSTSNNVVGGGIQKRKYNDGYYVSHGKNFDRKSTIEKTNLVSDEANVDSESLKQTSTEFVSNKVNNYTLPALSEKELEFIYDSQNYSAAVDVENEESVSSIEKQSDVKLGLQIKKPFSTNAKALRNITEKETSGSGAADTMLILLIILAFFLPWLSVGIFTSWDLTMTLITLLLWFLFVVPGIVFAILVLLGVI